MPENTLQASFNSGEWSPKLYGRVDLTKYRSGAAILENFFVDYRGGASTRPGTKYILQCYKSDFEVRLIPFQAGFNVGYCLEFGEQYVRFFSNGSPILETVINITAATKANPCVITVVGNSYAAGDWVFVDSIVGMTQLNGRYFIAGAVAGNLVTLHDLNGNNIDSTGYSTYVSGGGSSRVYTVATPYTATDLRKIKFAQNVNQLILCHESYVPYLLTLITFNNWTMLPITFGTTATAPAGLVASTTLAAGSVGYNYGVTSIDANGQESSLATVALSGRQDIRVVAGSNGLTWTAVPAAVGYNIYKTDVSYFGPPPAGLTYGYIGSSSTNSFVDSNIAPDYSQTPPVVRNPFIGAGVASVAMTNNGVGYTTVPTVSFTGAASEIAASAAAILQVIGTPAVTAGGGGYVVGDTVLYTNNVVLVVNTIGGGGAVTSWKAVSVAPSSPGSVVGGSTPANPVAQLATSGAGVGATATLAWGVGLVLVINPGAGYVATPTVTFSAGAAAATASLSPTSNGNPTVPGFFQQRLVLAAPNGAPETFYMSQPGAYYNYNVSTIARADDAITGTLVSGQLNTIKSMVPQTSGLLMFTDRNSWLINGGSNGSAISPTALVANAQSFNGISDIPPIVANFDVLYVQAKGSIVRDSVYNIYANVYTGTDISAISSHLFYGYTIYEWAWAEEPFKVVWAVRSDGVMLTLTFLKEQDFVGWAHSTTVGSFLSVATIIEDTDTAGEVDAVYCVTVRTINGNDVKYIERFAERTFPNGVEDAWCVDCGIAYSGPPATSFSGADFLANEQVTGLADGVVIPRFTMPANGAFTLTTPASKVVVGIPYTCRLQTLPLEMGDPTVQNEVKKINSVDVKVADTLGLLIGSGFDASLKIMKDLVVGNVSSTLTGQASQVVTDLVDGQAHTILDPQFTVPGQYCFEQFFPLPATILGVFPNVTVGNSDVRERRS